jgi:3-hydroxybutyrate dehydrogenase
MKNRTAIVTGSTSGIGLGIATCLARAGVNVMLNGFGDAQEIEKLRSGLEKDYGVRVQYHPADLRSPADIRAMVAEAEKAFGQVDILVNNAGIQYVSPVETFPEEKWNDVLAVNLSAAFHGSKAVLPMMQKNKFGRIINIGSAHAQVASKDKSAYVAAKHGLIGLSKVIALENATKGITCNTVCPGWVLTPLVQKQIDARAAAQGISTEQASQGLLAEKQPAMEFATAEQIGDMVVYLCSPSANLITGTALTIDGGWTAQ